MTDTQDRSRATPARDKLEAVGIEAICERLIAGETQTAIALDIEVSKAALIDWIASDADRSARAREARICAAGSYSDMAEAELRAAVDPFGLAKARELASHFRWKASKADPGSFGDRLELAGALELKKSAADMTDDELMAIASGRNQNNKAVKVPEIAGLDKKSE